MKISVVIPVYNAEKYLNRCLDSILAQTYDNWEVWAIDDGSKDNSLEVLNEYHLKDNRINVIHQENQGAGAARNRGIIEITGDYLVFIDSDDYIETDYFELLSLHNEDIVFIDVNRRNEFGRVRKVERLSTYKKFDKDYILRSQMTGKMLWGGVRKAVKTEIVLKHNIRYSSHRVGEEAQYSFDILYYSKSIGFIDKPVYNYVVHDGSLSQTLDMDPWGNVALALKDRLIFLGIIDEYSTTINSFIVTAAIVSLNNLAKMKNYHEFISEFYKKRKWVEYHLYNDGRIDREHMNKKALIILPFFSKRMPRIIYLAAHL